MGDVAGLEVLRFRIGAGEEERASVAIRNP
jgi:hypothetical protein